MNLWPYALCVWMIAGAWGIAGPAAAQEPPRADYYVYVGAESEDLLHRIRFGPAGAVLDRTIPVGEIAVETEGPHGLNISPDGRFLFMTTGHGVPDGKLWKFHAGPDTLVGDPILLGQFPATLDLTPDGLYAFVANFNLHGEMVPSSVSVVYTPDMIEVERIETCTMPHGARIDAAGNFLYSACMMDDQVVEIDTRSFAVSRRFSVAVDHEGALPAEPPPGGGHGHAGNAGASAGHTPPTCSPTWVVPTGNGHSLLVACNRGDRILEIDRESWSLARTFRTGRGPYNLALTPDDAVLVATLKQGAGVQFFDMETGRTLAVARSSTTVTHGVVTSPDGRYAFVSVEGVGAEPGKVDIFDLADFSRVAEVEVGQQAGGIVFWKMVDSTGHGGGRAAQPTGTVMLSSSQEK
ncbi:MAG: YncE family protein [Gemmatimonadetes bacterium]|nr:YncE family protein [Gemmatimonadota bacterium]MYB99777.1 YncE family protein [Gemmatimonadota bacterium]